MMHGDTGLKYKPMRSLWPRGSWDPLVMAQTHWNLHDFGNHNSKQLLCEVAHVAIVPGHRGRAGELRDLHDLLMDAAIHLLLAHVRHVPSAGGKEWCEVVMGLEWFGSVKNLISN